MLDLESLDYPEISGSQKPDLNADSAQVIGAHKTHGVRPEHASPITLLFLTFIDMIRGNSGYGDSPIR
jgi:hypothetical protein